MRSTVLFQTASKRDLYWKIVKMGCCFGCFRKSDDLNEINQDHILWLQTSSTLTTGIRSDLHFSIGGTSYNSNEEPAVVTYARKLQEKADREKGM